MKVKKLCQEDIERAKMVAEQSESDDHWLPEVANNDLKKCKKPDSCKEGVVKKVRVGKRKFGDSVQNLCQFRTAVFSLEINIFFSQSPLCSISI